MIRNSTTRSLRAFLIIWFGQLISLTGSGLTRFALGVWIYQATGSTTQFALTWFFPELAILVFTPLAGALVDRWDRRWAMIFGDVGAGLCTVIIAVLLSTDHLRGWPLYLATAASAAFSTFQPPAFSAITTCLVPKQHLGRASGLVQLGQAIELLISPVLAGLLVVTIRIRGVILIDCITFLFATSTLALVRIPQPQSAREDPEVQGSLLHEIAYGWKYITARRGLVAMLIFLAVISFNMGIAQILLTPLVLSFASAATLGTILSIGGFSMLAGSVVQSIWGGPKRRIYAVLGIGLLQGISLCLVGIGSNIFLITFAVSIFLFGFPIIVGSAEAVWLSKVAPHIQGRVFSIRNTIVSSTLPLAYLIAGPLADRVFEPALHEDDIVSKSIGAIIGIGAGRGIGLLFIALGVFVMLITAASFLYPRFRLVEDELPDNSVDEFIPTMEQNDKIGTEQQILVPE